MAGAGTTLALGGIGGALAFDHHLSTPNSALQTLRFESLKEAWLELEKLEKAFLLNPSKIELLGEWSLHQNLIHCAQSVEYSLVGYPKHKPAFIKKTVGKWVFEKFAAQNFMKHDRNEPIPAAAPLEKEGDLNKAFERLRKALTDFENHQGKYEPHFIYGQLDRAAYEKAHAFHLADHFSGLRYL